MSTRTIEKAAKPATHSKEWSQDLSGSVAACHSNGFEARRGKSCRRSGESTSSRLLGSIRESQKLFTGMCPGRISATTTYYSTSKPKRSWLRWMN